MILPGDFYEDDEPVEDVVAAFAAGEPTVSRSVEDLAAEQGLTIPQPLDSLRSELLDDEERQAFVEAAEGWRCEHMSIFCSHLIGEPTTGCGCEMVPLHPLRAV